MKTELLILAVLAMVVSSFLNDNVQARSNDNLAQAKIRIEKASQIHAHSLQIKTVVSNKTLTKPNEG